MQDRKNLHPTGYCSNIRNLHQAARAQLETLKAERQRAGQRVDEMQQPFFGKIDPAQEHQLRVEADEAFREVQRIESELERVEEQLDAYVNDYVLSGCQEVLGSL